MAARKPRRRAEVAQAEAERGEAARAAEARAAEARAAESAGSAAADGRTGASPGPSGTVPVVQELAAAPPGPSGASHNPGNKGADLDCRAHIRRRAPTDATA